MNHVLVIGDIDLIYKELKQEFPNDQISQIIGPMQIEKFREVFDFSELPFVIVKEFSSDAVWAVFYNFKAYYERKNR